METDLSLKRLFYILAVIIFITFGFFEAIAQQVGSISGNVVSKNGSVIGQAAISLKPGNLGTLSNDDGFFRIDGIMAGDYTLTASYLGYKPYHKKLVIVMGEVLILSIVLDTDIKLLSGVEVTGQHLVQEPYVRNILTPEKLMKLPANDVGEMLRNEPNVGAIRKGGSNLDPVVRGLKSGQLNIQYNSGQKIEGGCPNRMDPTTSHIEVSDISRLEVIKGPYALSYGPNLGAVVNMITLKARPFERFQVHARAIKGWESNFNGSKGHVTVFGGNKTYFFALSGNDHDYSNYQSGDGTEIPSSFRKYSFSAEAGVIPAKYHEIKLNYQNSQGRDIHFPALQMDERSDRTNLFSANWQYMNINHTLQRIEAKAYYSEVQHEMDNKWRPSSDTVVAVTTVNAINIGGRVAGTFRFEKTSLRTGFDYENIYKDGQRVKNLIMQPGLPKKIEDVWQDASIRNFGFFADYSYPLNLQINLVAAARIDVNDGASDPLQLKNMAGGEIYFNDDVHSNFTNISLNGGMIWNINEKISLDVALGRGVRSPDMVERFIILLPVGYDNYDYLGNPLLKPEKNFQADITFHYTSEKQGDLMVNGFFSLLNDYITAKKVPPSVLMPQTAGTLGVKQFQNTDRAYLCGFEMSWASPVENKLGGNLVAAYTTGMIPETEKYIIENGLVTGSETVKNDPLPEIPPFEATARIHYKMFRDNLIPELSLRAVAGQHRISEAYDEAETPGFVIAGFNIGYRVNDILTLSGGVNNLFNRNYYEHLNRRIIGSKAILYEPGRVFYLNVMVEL